MERRLAAIVAADVAGYSRLMGEDETGTLKRLQNLLKTVVQPGIERRKGRIVKLMGDGLLAEFASAVEAVEGAADIQRQMKDHEPDLPADKRIRLRIGVNLGDIIVEGSDIYGEGVNVAARVEALAEPGGICISGPVFDQVDGKTGLAFADGGEQTVKNISKPVRIYMAVLGDPQPADGTTGKAEPAATASGFSGTPSIAVLPFDNMSKDAEQEYFSDGLAEDIITALSHWRSFPVIARNSSFSYKGQAIRVQKIAEELGARFILEGGVRKAGNRLRITAQLIDAHSGHHVWAEKFDRLMEDIFDVQDEITDRIAATIVPELEQFEHRRTVLKRTEDLNAWDYYLRGMETFHDDTCEGTFAAIEMFRCAIACDANYVDAWARLAWALARLKMLGCEDAPADCLDEARSAARRAIALDDNSAVAHMGLGAVHIWSEQTALGLAEAQTALKLNPSFAHAAMAVGNRLDLTGHTQDGVAQMERALTLNPRDPNRWRYMAYLSRAHIILGQPEIAANWARQSMLLRPDLADALFRYAICLAHQDRIDDARELLEKCRAMEPGLVERRANWQPYPDKARNELLLSGLRRHNLI